MCGAGRIVRAARINPTAGAVVYAPAPASATPSAAVGALADVRVARARIPGAMRAAKRLR
jgi:hypothetical protein